MQRPSRLDMGGAFSLVAYVIAGVAVLAAAGVFGYGYYLGTVRDAKAKELITAQQGLSQSTVEDFVRLQDRLTSASSLLDKHVTLSGFFDALEKLTLKSVRFTSFKLTLQDDGSADIEMAGTAGTFNALAAQAAAFGTEPNIKRSVFSNIAVNKDNSVNFTMTATLAPALITGHYPTGASASGTAALPQPATSTATTTP